MIRKKFTPKDIASVPDPRYRALCEGVAAGSNENSGHECISIVYQDLMPVRIAGRMIFSAFEVNDGRMHRGKRYEGEGADGCIWVGYANN